MILRRRIAVYGLCRDGLGRVLMVRASERTRVPGMWGLPGGGVEHGENPTSALVREFAEETGVGVRVVGVRAAMADVVPSRDGLRHTDRITFDVEPAGPDDLAVESDGTTDLPAWFTPQQLTGVPVIPRAAAVLREAGVVDLPVAAAAGPTPDLPGALGSGAPEPTVRPEPAPVDAGQARERGQRFGAYGLVTDPAGRVLLTLIADGYPGAGRWHLPGGGTDFGEQPTEGLLRELVEETGQYGRVTRLLTVTHNHNPAAVGPEGYPVDWHVVRVIYRVEVDEPTEPVVREAAGSTARAAWWAPDEIDLTRVTSSSVKVLRAERIRR